MLKPLKKYWFSETDEPPNEARLPNAASPRTVPGASRATEVVSRDTGIFSMRSALRMVVDSTDDTSIGLIALLVTEIVPRVASAPPPAKFTGVPVPTDTRTPSRTVSVPSARFMVTR